MQTPKEKLGSMMGDLMRKGMSRPNCYRTGMHAFRFNAQREDNECVFCYLAESDMLVQQIMES